MSNLPEHTVAYVKQIKIQESELQVLLTRVIDESLQSLKDKNDIAGQRLLDIERTINEDVLSAVLSNDIRLEPLDRLEDEVKELFRKYISDEDEVVPLFECISATSKNTLIAVESLLTSRHEETELRILALTSSVQRMQNWIFTLLTLCAFGFLSTGIALGYFFFWK